MTATQDRGATDRNLGAQDILDLDDSKIERVDVPEWQGHVYVRTLAGEERDYFEQLMLDSRGKRKEIVQNIRASLASLCVCDQDGQRLFTVKQIVQLGKKNAKALDRIFGVAQRLSGLSEKDIDELVKNSVGAQSADSTTS